MDGQNDPSSSVDNEGLDAATALQTYATQHTRTTAKLGFVGRVDFVTWGLAWLIAYGALWFGAGVDGFPRPWALAVFAVCITIAIAISTVIGIRSSNDIVGRTSQAAAMLGPAMGLSWFVGMGALTAVVMTYPMPMSAVAVLYNLVAALLVGLQFTSMAAILADRTMFGMGIGMMILCLVATWMGVPFGYLAMAILGGGGQIAVVAVQTVRARTPR